MKAKKGKTRRVALGCAARARRPQAHSTAQTWAATTSGAGPAGGRLQHPLAAPRLAGALPAVLPAAVRDPGPHHQSVPLLPKPAFPSHLAAIGLALVKEKRAEGPCTHPRPRVRKWREVCVHFGGGFQTFLVQGPLRGQRLKNTLATVLCLRSFSCP